MLKNEEKVIQFTEFPVHLGHLYIIYLDIRDILKNQKQVKYWGVHIMNLQNLQN